MRALAISCQPGPWNADVIPILGTLHFQVLRIADFAGPRVSKHFYRSRRAERLRQQPALGGAAGAGAPGDDDLARLGWSASSGRTVTGGGVGQARLHRHGRQEGDAEARAHHLHQGRQRGGGEGARRRAAARAARPQAASACSRRQWPSSSRIRSSSSSALRRDAAPRRSADGWPGRRPAARRRPRRPSPGRPCRRAGRSAPRRARRPSAPRSAGWVRSSRRNSRSLGKRSRSSGSARGSRNGRDGRDHAQAEAAGQRLAGAAGRLHQVLGLRPGCVGARAPPPRRRRSGSRPERPRSTTGAPRIFSSSCMPADSVGWVTCAASAARLNEPCSASSLRYCSWRRVGSMAAI